MYKLRPRTYLALRSTPMRGRENWEVNRKKRYSEDHCGWTFHPISLSSIGTYSVVSYSGLGARTVHRCCIVRRASPPLPPPPDHRICAARRCATGSPTDSFLMEPVNTARGTLCFPNEIPKIYFGNSSHRRRRCHLFSVRVISLSIYLSDNNAKLQDNCVIGHFYYIETSIESIRNGVASLCDWWADAW